jgi:hypothetical protein
MKVEEILNDYPESTIRQRRWVSIEEATELVDMQKLKDIFQDVPSIIEQYTNKKPPEGSKPSGGLN